MWTATSIADTVHFPNMARISWFLMRDTRLGMSAASNRPLRSAVNQPEVLGQVGALEGAKAKKDCSNNNLIAKASAPSDRNVGTKVSITLCVNQLP